LTVPLRCRLPALRSLILGLLRIDCNACVVQPRLVAISWPRSLQSGGLPARVRRQLARSGARRQLAFFVGLGLRLPGWLPRKLPPDSRPVPMTACKPVTAVRE